MSAALTARPMRRETGVLTICPNAMLGFLGMTALLLTGRLGALAALTFVVCTLVLMLRSPLATLTEAKQNVLLWLVMGWALLSMIWSAYPELSLRYGIQLAMTFGFAIALASRVSPLVFLKIAALSYGLIGLAGLLFGRVRGDGAGWLGMFNSKNAFAGASGFMVIACAALALDRHLPRHMRLLSALGCALGLYLVVKGQSVGVLLALTGALAAMGIVLVFRRFRPLWRLVVLALSALLLALLILAIVSWIDEVSAVFVETTGKDLTFTGRTYLWEVAFAEIAKSPLLGQGFQAVWVIGNPVAEEMWLEFGIESKVGFHFHNTFISNAVELGIIGVLLQSSVFFGTLFVILRWAQRDVRAETLFFAGVMVRQLILSMSEVVYFFQFDATSILTIAAAVYAGRYLRAQHTVEVSPLPVFKAHPRMVSASESPHSY